MLHFQAVEGHLFDSALATALQICRAVADHHLPIEEMLVHVDAATEDRFDAPGAAVNEVELEAIRTIIAAVGDVADIGSRLPAPVDAPQPIRVPSPPPGGPSLILFAD